MPGLQESYYLNIRYLRSCRSLINKVVLNVKYSWQYLPHALCRKKRNRRKVIKKKPTENYMTQVYFEKNSISRLFICNLHELLIYCPENVSDYVFTFHFRLCVYNSLKDSNECIN